MTMTRIDAPRRAALPHPDAMRLAATEYQRFLDLLRTLQPGDWAKPTECAGWDVRAMAAGMTPPAAVITLCDRAAAESAEYALMDQCDMNDTATALCTDALPGSSPAAGLPHGDGRPEPVHRSCGTLSSSPRFPGPRLHGGRAGQLSWWKSLIHGLKASSRDA
jgi:mycothiol maleylpyruvate isomerase-like protein